ncbi:MULTISPECIES: hypothetical protein [Corallococcus]|nr:MULTISPECIES: hypothetical protein [Corallococcus]
MADAQSQTALSALRIDRSKATATVLVRFVLLSSLSAMLAFFSSALLLPVALQAWGKAVCALLLWLGWMLGGACAYGIARAWGRPVIRRLTSASLLAR